MQYSQEDLKIKVKKERERERDCMRKIYRKTCRIYFVYVQNETRKQPTWWLWWLWRRWNEFSRSIIPCTCRNSSTWQGIAMVPFWSNPYSSSASFSNCMNRGWLKYITGTTNLCCSSPFCPTLTAKHPFGTAAPDCRRLSPLPIPTTINMCIYINNR